MRQRLAFTLCLSAICSLMQTAALAQQDGQNFYRAPSSFAGKTVVLPIGTTFEGRIQSTIGSSHSRSGETFSVEVSAPVLANGSEVLIPSGSEVVGEVAEAISSSAQPHDKNQFRPMGICEYSSLQSTFPMARLIPWWHPLPRTARAAGGRLD